MKNYLLFWMSCMSILPTFAQTECNFLDPILTSQRIEEYAYSPIIYKVEESDLLHKIVHEHKSKKSNNNQVTMLKELFAQKGMAEKLNFVISDTISANVLSGPHEVIGKYHPIIEDKDDFFKNELVAEQALKQGIISKNNILSNLYNTLIVNCETGQYYFVKYDFLAKLSVSEEDYKKTRLASYNARNRKNMVVSRSYSLDYTVAQYEGMIQRCKVLTIKLAEYNKLLEKGYMSKEQYANWKRDLVEAKLLNYRIEDFNKVYKSKSYSLEQYVNVEVIEDYIDFSKTLSTADLYAEF